MTPLVISVLMLVGFCFVILAHYILSSKVKSDPVQSTPGVLTTEYRPFPLVSREPINSNSFVFRFQLPSSSSRLGLPIGKHLLLKFVDVDGNSVSRPYTPTTSDEELGYFDLVVKVYPTGKMGPFLASLPLDQTIQVRGPLGELEYKNYGLFSIRRKVNGRHEPVPQQTSHIGMIAGGTGITPMLQIMRQVAKQKNDKTKISLIYANVTESDILLKSELDGYASSNENIKIYYSLDRPSEPTKWTGCTGFVTSEMIQKYLPSSWSDGLILMCGPKPMTDSMEKYLQALDFKEKQYFRF